MLSCVRGGGWLSLLLSPLPSSWRSVSQPGTSSTVRGTGASPAPARVDRRGPTGLRGRGNLLQLGECLRATGGPDPGVFDDSLLGVDRGRFCPVADFELVVDVFKVLADGPGADEERLRDHGVSLACGGPGQDDSFAWRKAL